MLYHLEVNYWRDSVQLGIGRVHRKLIVIHTTWDELVIERRLYVRKACTVFLLYLLLDNMQKENNTACVSYSERKVRILYLIRK